MRALIIGSTGFLGRNLCEYLAKAEIEYDTVGRDWLVPLDTKYDFVFYLAGEVRNVEAMWDANLNLLYKMLCRFIHMKQCVFIYVGSSSEYGHMDRPMKETDPINPIDFYSTTKGMGTMLCQGFAKQFGKQIVIIRPSSIYGKYERPEKFIPTVIRKLVNFEQIDVYRGFHDWLHVDDFIEAIFTILEDGDVKGDIYNVSSGIDWSNAEITSMIQAVGGTLNDNIVIHDYYFHPHDTERWVVDNSKLIKLGWKPQYNILSGLEKTVIDIMDTMT